MIFIILFVSSCRLPRLLKENEYLLDNNRVKVNNDDLRDGLFSNIKQRPNRKILGTFKFHLTVYRLASTFRRTNRLSTFLANKIGEPPVILDSTLCEQSVKQLQLYLRNNGFYQAKVSFNVRLLKVSEVLRLATVTYQIETGSQLTNADVVYMVNDSAIRSIINKSWRNSLIKTYKPFISNEFIYERERIAHLLRNEGYFTFTKDYILYDIDTSSDKAHVKMILRNPSEAEHHRVYTIKSISVSIDSLSTGESSKESVFCHGIQFFKNGYKLNEELIQRGIRIAPGMLFRQDSVEETYASLVQIQLFKFVNIRFEPGDTLSYELHCKITLSPRLKQDVTWEPTFTIADQPNANNITNQPYRNYGIANVFSYTNNNLLNKADIFKIRLRNTFEAQFRENNNIYFSLENSLNFSLDLPGRSPVGFIHKPTNLSNRSQVTASVIYEKNRDFDRRLLVMGYGYNYKLRRFPNTSFTWMPFELSYIKTENLSAALDKLLNKPEGAFLKSLFGKNFINSTRFSLLYHRNFSKAKTFSLRYTPLEIAGNMLNIFIQEKDTDQVKKIFGVRFFNYLKSEADLRYAYAFTSKTRTAIRCFAGLGLPYGNSNIMPYEKRYFSGGSNSLRGWRPRTLGPGTFNDKDNPLNRTGDMKLEVNMELRFPLPLYKSYFEGALFMDAGNIWNIYKNDLYPNADFDPVRIKEDIALDAGFGLRMIFPFFIIRADAAIPLRDPGQPSGKRYVYQYQYNSFDNLVKGVNLSFGIGYPF